MTIERIDLDFESEVVGRRTARLNIEPGTGARALRAAFVDAGKACVDHLVATVGTEDLAGARALAEAGFVLVDVSVVLGRPPEEGGPAVPEVRPAMPADRGALLERCSPLFRLSRFYRDPFFSAEEADAIHRRWIDNAFAGRADAIFVAERDGEPVGFLSAVRRPAKSAAHIELLAVAPGAAGQGLGHELTAAALRFYRGRVDEVTVKTQAHNYAALAVYGRAGFRTLASELSFTATTG